MKKNLLIMMMMVLCAGFASAQTINTVHGFVPGGSTGDGDNATYVVFGVPFSTINADGPKEMSVTLAQMQLVYDTVEDVISCGEAYNANGISLSADSIQSLVICNKEDNNQEGQRAYLKLQIPNGAQYNYDSLLVVNLYICPCTKTDDEENDYQIIALDSKCWFKSNLRMEDDGNGLLYNSDMTEVQDDSIYGRLYTWETVLKGDVCDNDGYLRGICPEGWHLPTVEEMGYLFGTPAENLRYDGNWVVEGNNNVTEFSAQPAGYYNASTQRFEGLFSETDFWMVDCNKLNNNTQDVLQLVYSCNTPLRISRPVDDAISVRCVYDIVKKLEDCDTNLIPIPIPIPETDCPTFGTLQPTEDLLGFSCPVTGEIDQVKLECSGVLDYTVGSDVPGTTGSAYINESVNLSVDNGVVTWHYELPSNAQPENVTVLSVVLSLKQGDCVDTVKNTLRNVTPPANDCPTVTITPAYFDKIEGKIAPYSPNDSYSIVITGAYQGVFQDEPTSGDLVDEEVVDINDDGTFTWYPNYNQYDIDEFTGLTGQFTITGPVDGCSQTLDFTTDQDCNLSVGPLSFVDGVAQVEITNFDPDYFEDIQIEYNGDQSYHPTSDDFETVPGSNITTLSHQLPSGANSVDALFELKHNYYACGEDDEYYIIRTLCPTVSDFDVTADGVSVSVNNYDPNEIELQSWEYQIIYNDNNPNEWIEDQNVQPQVNNGVATFTSSIPSLPTMDNVQAIKVYVRFIFSSSQCYPQGDDAYDISTTVYSQQ